MHAINTGDMARKIMLQHRSNSIKNELNRLTQELASGQISESRHALNGQQGYLADMQGSRKTLAAYNREPPIQTDLRQIR